MVVVEVRRTSGESRVGIDTTPSTLEGQGSVGYGIVCCAFASASPARQLAIVKKNCFDWHIDALSLFSFRPCKTRALTISTTPVYVTEFVRTLDVCPAQE